MAELEMLPSWAGRIHDSSGPPLPPSEFALGHQTATVPETDAEQPANPESLVGEAEAVEVEPEAEALIEVEPEAEAEIEAEAEALIEVDSEPEAEAEVLIEVEPEVDVEAEIEPMEPIQDLDEEDGSEEERDDEPIEEWVANPTSALTTTDADPVAVIDTGRGRPVLRVLAILLLAVAILAAGVAAGYLFTSLTGG